MVTDLDADPGTASLSAARGLQSRLGELDLLLSAACSTVDGGDDAVGRGPLKDAEAAVVGLLDVLAGHCRQQCRRLGGSRSSRWPRRA